MTSVKIVLSKIMHSGQASPFRSSAALILTMLTLVVATATTTATAQTRNTPLQHIILVIQENRTPDNLFGSNPSFLPGVDIATEGTNSKGEKIPLAPRSLTDCYGLDHFGKDWRAMYDHGKMDGADKVRVVEGTHHCTKLPDNPQFKYVIPGDVKPYFQIAENWGFANYMFHTNQGPSPAAHQFLFSGTAAPDEYGEQYYQYFASEIGGAAPGCLAPADDVTVLIGPDGKENTFVYPCFHHPTLATLLDPAGISWRYYAQKAQGIWTAPIMSQDICQPNADHTQCTGPDWNNNVVIRGVNGAGPAEILPDISTNCTLAT